MRDRRDRCIEVWRLAFLSVTSVHDLGLSGLQLPCLNTWGPRAEVGGLHSTSLGEGDVVM